MKLFIVVYNIAIHHQENKNLKDSMKILKNFRSRIYSLKKLSVDADNGHLIQYANTKNHEKLMLRENL